MGQPRFDRMFPSLNGTLCGIIETGDCRYSSWYEWECEWRFYRDVEASSVEDAVEQVCLMQAGFLEEIISI